MAPKKKQEFFNKGQNPYFVRRNPLTSHEDEVRPVFAPLHQVGGNGYREEGGNGYREEEGNGYREEGGNGYREGGNEYREEGAVGYSATTIDHMTDANPLDLPSTSSGVRSSYEYHDESYNVLQQQPEERRNPPSNGSCEPPKKKREQRCCRCANHNFTVSMKGHKNFCPFIDCDCDYCLVTTMRQKFMKEQQKITRRQHLRYQQQQALATGQNAGQEVESQDPGVFVGREFPSSLQAELREDLERMNDLGFLQQIDELCKSKKKH